MISEDIPNIFVKTQTKSLASSSEIRFSGPDGRICELFCEKLNVNCSFVFLQPDSMEKFNLTIDDVAFNPSLIVYEATEYNIMKMYLYPVYFDAVVIIVRASRPLTKLMLFYFQFGYSGEALLIILASSIIMLCILRLWTLNHFSFIDICGDILSITFKLDLRKLFKLRLKECLVILPTILLGFVIINTVIFLLTAFYTTNTYYQPDVNSLSDIDELTCSKIAVSKEHSMTIIPEFSEFNWSSRFVLLNQWEMSHQLFRFDTTTCFIDSSRRADLLMQYQKRSLRILHVVKPDLVPQLYGYMIHPKSPHKHRFNELILNVMSSGLYSKWSSDIYIELYEEHILNHFVENSNDNRPSSLELVYIFWPLNIFVYGSLLSILIFCVELLISYYSR